MSEEINLDEIKKFWPKEAPDIVNISKYIKKYKNENDRKKKYKSSNEIFVKHIIK